MSELTTLQKLDFITYWIDQGEKVRSLLEDDGPAVIRRLALCGYSLRQIARKTKLSTTYLCVIAKGTQRISPTAYATLLALEIASVVKAASN